MTASNRSKARFLAKASTLAALFLMLEGCPPPGVGGLYNPNEQIGFPAAAAGTITIDGLATEAAWGPSFKFYLEDGASSSEAFMRGMKDAAGNIYLYAEAEDMNYDTFDALLLAFNATDGSGPGAFERLVIYPCSINPGAGVCAGQADPSTAGGFNPTVSSQTGTLSGSNVNWDGAAGTGAPPPGVTVKSNVAPNGILNRWSVEIKLDHANFTFPATGSFGMFADVIKTNADFTAKQFTWPRGTFVHSGTNDPNDVIGTLEGVALPLARWGHATQDLSSYAAGLQVTGLSNTGTDPTKISLTGPNEFFATAANYPAGNGPDASGVTTTFKINNIGLNPDWTWTNIPSATNPTTPGQTIHQHEYMTFSSGDWTLATFGNWQGSGQTERAFFTAHPHQCVMIELNRSGGGGPISRQFNMDFVTVNSPFQVESQIGTGSWLRQYEGARGVTLNEVFLNGGADFKWQSMFEGAEPAGEHRWIIKSLSAQTPTQILRTSILAGPSLKVPSQDFTLDPVALSKGKPMDIPVKPGSILTLLADGEATIKQRPVTAAGMSADAAKRAEIQAGNVPDVLRPGGGARVGALLGSFDGFRTSFQIGAGTTIFVPYDAQRLQVGFAQGTPFDGGRFMLQAVMTEANGLALDGRSLESLRGAKGPVLLALGANLPAHIVRGTLDTGTFIIINKKQFRVGVPMGSYGSFVRRVGGSTMGTQVAPTGLNVASGLAATPAIRVKPR